MAKVRVKPAPGATVKLPGLPKHRNAIPAEGMEVERDMFIERLLMSGDLAEVTAETKRGGAAA